MICTTYFLTFFSELIPPTGIYIFFVRINTPHRAIIKNAHLNELDRHFLFKSFKMELICFDLCQERIFFF